jgi:ABC-type multidrug transport system ATPase subunit
VTSLIDFRGVGMRYAPPLRRPVTALDDVWLEVRAGEVLGIAGPNGAGKSTLIALLLGFLGPSAGAVRIDGLEPRRYVSRFGVSYLSELVNVPPAWRVSSALRRYAILARLPTDVLHVRVEAVIAALGLEEHRTKRVRQLSKGNLQRLGLAQALLGEERVVVLDEPTHGLDPVWTQRFRDVVDQLRRPDRTILIASHNLDELARLADRVGIIDRGRLQRVVDVRANERVVTEGTPYRLVVSSGEARVPEVFPAARVVASAEFEIVALSLGEINDGVGRLIQGGVLVRALYPVHSALEQQFREVVSSSDGAPAEGGE